MTIATSFVVVLLPISWHLKSRDGFSNFFNFLHCTGSTQCQKCSVILDKKNTYLTHRAKNSFKNQISRIGKCVRRVCGMIASKRPIFTQFLLLSDHELDYCKKLLLYSIHSPLSDAGRHLSEVYNSAASLH